MFLNYINVFCINGVLGNASVRVNPARIREWFPHRMAHNLSTQVLCLPFYNHSAIIAYFKSMV